MERLRQIREEGMHCKKFILMLFLRLGVYENRNRLFRVNSALKLYGYSIILSAFYKESYRKWI